MPPRARRPSAIRAPAPGVAVSPAMYTAPSTPIVPTAPTTIQHSALTLPLRNPNEKDLDYASRLFATEALRSAHSVETATLQTRQDKQIAELKSIVAKFSDREKAILLKRYEDLASKEVRELKEAFAQAVWWTVLVVGFLLWWFWPREAVEVDVYLSSY